MAAISHSQSTNRPFNIVCSLWRALFCLCLCDFIVHQWAFFSSLWDTVMKVMKPWSGSFPLAEFCASVYQLIKAWLSRSLKYNICRIMHGKIWINSWNIAIYQVRAAWQLSDWSSIIKLNCKYMTELHCSLFPVSSVMHLLPLLLFQPPSNNSTSLPCSYLEGWLPTKQTLIETVRSSCTWGRRGSWSWSRLSWGEDGATSRQRTSHANACGNVWDQYQSALMCAPLHCRGKQSSCRETRQIQGGHANSTQAARAPNQRLSANQFVFDRLTSMTF